MRMTINIRLDRRIRLLFHISGLSCLGGAIFLQILVFADILQQGYFMAVESNPAILMGEIALTAFALIYFGYIYQRFVRSIK
jgi:polyferredoxin